MSNLMTRRAAWLGTLAVTVAAISSGCIVQTDTDDGARDEGTGGSGASDATGGAGGGGGGQPADATTLFVINNGAEPTSYASAASLDGEIVPTTRISLGSSTSLFQPRDVVLTSSGRLLIASQAGSIVGWDGGTSVDGEAAATLVVDDANLGIGTLVTFAYNPTSDALYVGGAQMNEGMVVLADASGGAFEGELSPARTFGPSDRVPHDPDGTIALSVDAMVLDADGRLFFSDTSGLHVNNSRVLVYDDPSGLDGLAEPDAVLTSSSWVRIEDMAIDAAGALYVVDSSASVFVFDDAASLAGEVTPDRTINIGIGMASLTGIELSNTGIGYLADDANHSVYSLDGIALVDGAADPSRTLDGFETRLRNPRKMFLLEP